MGHLSKNDRKVIDSGPLAHLRGVFGSGILAFPFVTVDLAGSECLGVDNRDIQLDILNVVQRREVDLVVRVRAVKLIGSRHAARPAGKHY
jgi:hypothetical protein